MGTTIYLRKSVVVFERMSVCKSIEKLMEYGIHCLSSSCIYDVINLIPYPLRPHIAFKVTSSGCNSVKALSTTVGYSLVALMVHVTDLCRYLTYDSRGACYTVYDMLLSNYK